MLARHQDTRRAESTVEEEEEEEDEEDEEVEGEVAAVAVGAENVDEVDVDCNFYCVPGPLTINCRTIMHCIFILFNSSYLY